MSFNTEKNKSSNQPVWLYTVENYDGASNNLTFAEHDADIVYDGITYVKFPVTHQLVGENNQGEIEQVTVKIANVNRVIQTYLELYDLRSKKVTITLVWADQLADADNNIQFVYYIDSYTAGQEVAEFLLSPKTDVLSVTLPARFYSRNYCSWKFKSTECGYAGAGTTCNKTKVACKALGNYLRYGACPSVPTRRIYV